MPNRIELIILINASYNHVHLHFCMKCYSENPVTFSSFELPVWYQCLVAALILTQIWNLYSRLHGNVWQGGPIKIGLFLANMNWRSHSLYAYAVARPSVCRLSVCNARASSSGGCNFWQFFYGIWYLGHPLTSMENFMEMSQRNPSVRGVKHKRGSQI